MVHTYWMTADAQVHEEYEGQLSADNQHPPAIALQAVWVADGTNYLKASG